MTDPDETPDGPIVRAVPFEASDRFIESMREYWAKHDAPMPPKPRKRPPTPGKQRKPKH